MNKLTYVAVFLLFGYETYGFRLPITVSTKETKLHIVEISDVGILTVTVDK